MATPVDYSQTHLSSPWTERAKVFLGALIALLLTAIIIVLIIVPIRRDERVIKMTCQPDENLIRLQGQQALERENLRQQREDQRHRLDREMSQDQHDKDRKQAERLHHENLEFLWKQKQYEEDNNQRVLQEKLQRENRNLVDEFTEQLLTSTDSVIGIATQSRFISLVRTLDPVYRSLLIQSLYQKQLIQTVWNNSIPQTPRLHVRGANLNNLNLDQPDPEMANTGLWTNFSGLALPLSSLINASFRHLDLAESNFSRSYIVGSSFSQSNLTMADFYRANVSYSDLSKTMLIHSNFNETIAVMANFHDANLSLISFTNSMIDKANFDSADATRGQFQNSSLTSTSFKNTILIQTRLDNSIIQEADFSMVTALNTNFSFSDLSYSRFRFARLNQTSFRGATLTNVEFDYASMRDVDLSHADLTGAQINQGQLSLALSIAKAQLPDGTIGINKNFLLADQAVCNISRWETVGQIISITSNRSHGCTFQAEQINSTMKKTFNLMEYRRLIDVYPTFIYVKRTIGGNFNVTSNQIFIRFFIDPQTEIDVEGSSLNEDEIEYLPDIISRFKCPPGATRFTLTLTLKEIKSTLTNLYVTVE